MQQVWLALIGGLILGWLIEWVIDWWFWRRNLAELRRENQELRRQLDAARSPLQREADQQPAGPPNTQPPSQSTRQAARQPSQKGK